MKRACCLYIIPVKSYFNETERELLRQKGSCYSFATQQGWYVAKELKGVDTIGNHALKDITTPIKKAALNDEYDILLVYSYSLMDSSDIAPFMIEWLINQGKEVWSVAEGQQTCVGNIDKILNHLRYWECESIKRHSDKTIGF